MLQDKLAENVLDVLKHRFVGLHILSRMELDGVLKQERLLEWMQPKQEQVKLK
ncbi:hypothetical protein [Lysinibacillus sp. NPDC086135]|uniref:hypothetical protein n=1 Tax=Lysinibacillus sp. NPDC086135 TaxID=3364130 RepID=UPI00382BAC0B